MKKITLAQAGALLEKADVVQVEDGTLVSYCLNDDCIEVMWDEGYEEYMLLSTNDEVTQKGNELTFVGADEEPPFTLSLFKLIPFSG